MIRDMLAESWSALSLNWKGSALTIAGMAWGVATVVLLLAYGSGFAVAIRSIFSTFGTNSIGIYAGRTTMQAGGAKVGARIQLDFDDVEQIRNTVPLMNHISPELGKNVTASANGRSYVLNMLGHHPSIAQVRNLRISEGRFYSRDDMVRNLRVMVIGPEARTRLFLSASPLGAIVNANGIPFTVIGVLQPRMQEGDSDINRQLYVPITAMSQIKHTRHPDGIWLDYENAQGAKVESMVRGALAATHQFSPKDTGALWIFNIMERMKQFEHISIGLQLLLGMIGTLTLGIGGVGLMNMMFVAVAHRMSEIGTRRAIGARKRHILVQFLAEALLITFGGGALGILFAIAISYFVKKLTFFSALASHADEGDIRLIVSTSNLIIVTAIFTVVGILSGMLPAIRAANVDPIEALRTD